MRTLPLMLLFCIVLFKANSQPGSLDSTFGNNGIQTTGFFNLNLTSEEGRTVLTSANRDIFVVASINSLYTGIIKYLPDGRLDSSYGNGGYSNNVRLDVYSAALQGDRIIVAGYAYNPVSFDQDFAIARYSADGTLDASFGEKGLITTDFNGSSDEARSIVLQGDKIIIAGYTFNPVSGNSDFALARYTADGELDFTFGNQGKVTTDFNGNYNGVDAMVLQGDKIIVAGNVSNPVDFNNDFALARYTTDGTLDSSFGVNGLVTTDFNNTDDEARSIALQGDKIIVAGITYLPDFTTDYVLARYTADGILDASFGEHGKVTTDFNGSNDEARSIVLQDDKIIVAGNTVNPDNGNNDYALVRYTADGALDASFGTNGKVTSDLNNFSDDQANAIALQDDKMIVAGYTSISFNRDFALARYTTDGTLDSSFGEQGLLTGYFASSQTYFTSTAIQGNKIIAVGYALNSNGNDDFILARYTTNGRLDSSFGEQGKVTTDFYNDFNRVNSIALQGNKILVIGGATNQDNFTGDFALVRYTADGTLDSSFGVNGLVTTDFNSSNEVPYSIAVQGDKIIVAGYTNNQDNFTGDFALARYMANGTLDASFGVNGRVSTDFNNSDEGVTSIVFQGDKIIAAGYTVNANSKEFTLARYTADGTLDASFGTDGKVTTYFNGTDLASAIAIQGDKIIAAGNTLDTVSFTTAFALARYTADGSLDASFGEQGKVTTNFNNNSFDAAASIAIQGDKIIAAGNTYNIDISKNNFALARYTADGTLDSSFGVSGKVITDLDGNASIQDIALNENRLFAVGSVSQFIGGNYGVVAVYQLEATEPSICISDVTVCESQKQAVLTVQLSAPSTQVIRLYYKTHHGTAHTPQDYIGGGAILYFAVGTTTATIKIPIVNDSVCEPTEQFEVLLSNACHATIKDSIAIVTIKDDDCSLIAAQANTSSLQEKSTPLSISASPNPSADAFTIQLHSTDLKQQVSIRVYDVSGRLMEEREHISIGQVLHLGNQYKAGTYIIEAMQGTRRVQIKVIKTGK
jgi:uncharacterized delta-60 repeat protein